MRIALIGAEGRLGGRIRSLASQSPYPVLILPILRSTPPEQWLECARSADLLLDVSSPSAFTTALSTATAAQKPLIVGTTGFSDREREEMEEAGRRIPLLYAPNFSLGVTHLLPLVKQLSLQLGTRFALAIRETHHVGKRDTPSGTALELAAASGRKPPIESKREDAVVGEHQLCFSSPHEEITITHRALSRDLFAEGALLAARRLIDAPPGFYKMHSLFSLENNTPRADDR